MLFGLLIALAIIILDQLSKYVVLYHLLDGYSMQIYGPFFNLVRAWNTGVSFSMFHGHGELGKYVLAGLALVIVGFLINWLRSEKSRLMQASLGFVIGGALGNIIDRVRFGAVFDFLDFHLNESHYPAFNVADSFICIGATIIVIYSIFGAAKNGKKA